MVCDSLKKLLNLQLQLENLHCHHHTNKDEHNNKLKHEYVRKTAIPTPKPLRIGQIETAVRTEPRTTQIQIQIHQLTDLPL